MDKIENNTNIRSVEIRRGKDLWAKTPHRDAAEFTDMRYTAVDCAQPIEFDKYGYKIRCGENGRSVKCLRRGCGKIENGLIVLRVLVLCLGAHNDLFCC
jgi:hypothetical protein